MSRGEKGQICACGHRMTKHELVGTEYSRCFDPMIVQDAPCKCAGGEARAVVWTDNEQFFMRKSRGKAYPHALEGACKKALEAGAEVILLVESCELCGSTLDNGAIFSVALDNDGRMYSGKTRTNRAEGLRTDLGYNRVICGGCDALRGD